MSSLNLGAQTNLISLLQEIRNLSNSGDLEKAQELAAEALSQINETEETKFYLRQIRKEETKLYFDRANQAMRDKNYSLASRLLEKYRENVALDLSERKIQREVVANAAGPSDSSLVGRLVEELDKAKKGLRKFAQKLGCPKMILSRTSKNLWPKRDPRSFFHPGRRKGFCLRQEMQALTESMKKPWLRLKKPLQTYQQTHRPSP